MANKNGKVDDGSTVPPREAKVFISCVEDVIGEVEDVAITISPEEAKHIRVLCALVNTKALNRHLSVGRDSTIAH
jgi:hypothetical protein